MIRAWRSFRALSGREQRLFGEAASLLFLVSVGASLLPFRTLRRLLARPRAAGASSDRLPPDEVRRITGIVVRASRRLPLRSTCLVQALVAHAMLSRRGCACEIRFGVRAPAPGSPPDGGPSASITPTAHAWIEHRGVVVLGGLDDLNEYTVLNAPRSS